MTVPYSRKLRLGASHLLIYGKKKDDPYTEEQLSSAVPNEELRRLLRQCWSKEPADRPDMSEVVARVRTIGGFEYVGLVKAPQPKQDVVEDMSAGMLTPPETPPELDVNSIPLPSV